MKVDAVQLAGILSYVAKAADVDTADSLAAHIAALEKEHDAALSRAAHLERQRTHVAGLLSVADAGAYQNDWETPVRKALVRARNEGLETAAEAVDLRWGTGGSTAAGIRAMKEPESD